MIATWIVQGFAKPPSRDWIGKLRQNGRPIERSEFVARICFAKLAQCAAPHTVIRKFIEKTVGNSRSQNRQKASAPERFIGRDVSPALRCEEP